MRKWQQKSGYISQRPFIWSHRIRKEKILYRNVWKTTANTSTANNIEKAKEKKNISCVTWEVKSDMSRENEQHEKTCSVLHNERKSEKNTAFSLSIAVFDSIGDHLCEKKVACKSKCGIFGCLFEFKNFSFHCSL